LGTRGQPAWITAAPQQAAVLHGQGMSTGGGRRAADRGDPGIVVVADAGGVDERPRQFSWTGASDRIGMISMVIRASNPRPRPGSAIFLDAAASPFSGKGPGSGPPEWVVVEGKARHGARVVRGLPECGAYQQIRVLDQDRLIPVAAGSAGRAALFRLPGRTDTPIPYLGDKNALADFLKSMAVARHGHAWLPEDLIAADLAQKRLPRAGGPEWDPTSENQALQGQARNATEGRPALVISLAGPARPPTIDGQ